MYLKKLLLLLLFFPLVGLAGCDEKELDMVLVQNIWKEVLKINELDPNLEMPRVVLLEKDAKPEKEEDCSKYPPEELKNCEADNEARKNYYLTLGKAYFDRIEIYLPAIEEALGSERRKCNCWLIEEGRVYPYETIAHEMNHHALWKKGVVNSFNHHQMMKESGIMEKILDYISDQLEVPRDGIHKESSNRSLDAGIKWEQLQKRRMERRKNLLRNENQK